MQNRGLNDMKSTPEKRVIVIPCSGIGKSLGSISRDATYEVVETLRRGLADTTCLALIISGDEETLQLLKNSKCIAVDGCPLECAAKNIKLAGGQLAAAFKVVNVLKENRGLKPRSVTFLDSHGEQLANLLASQIASKVDELLRSES